MAKYDGTYDWDDYILSVHQQYLNRKLHYVVFKNLFVTDNDVVVMYSLNVEFNKLSMHRWTAC